MLGRLTLPTKLALLVVSGVIGTLAVGVPEAIGRVDRWHATTSLPAEVATVRALGGFQSLVEREATLSSWFLASGDPAARRRLAEARPRTDRAARDLTGAHRAGSTRRSTAIDRVRQAWTSLRLDRAQIDRRVVSDTAALAQFDRVTASVGHAIDVGLAGVADGGEAVVAALRSRAAASDLESAIAREQAALVIVTARAAISAPLVDRVQAAAIGQDLLRGSTLASARRELGAKSDATIERVRSTGDPVRTMRAPALRGLIPFATPEQWLARSDTQLRALAEIERSLDATAATLADARRHMTRSAALRWIALLAAVVAGITIAGLALRRAVRRPLQLVARTAGELAARERDATVSRDANGNEPSATPVAVRTRDEVGDIARALHALDTTARDASTGLRRSLHNDIGDLYVNIARRNQPLLSRQLALIHGLEASDADPKRSDSLVQLDHLANRMRRNSESLLVLAGLDPLRSHADPVPLLDVVRGAVSEIEEFRRVDIVGVPLDAAIVGRVAADLVHVLAEIIENATSYSPPETRVFIGARRRPTEIEITVSDEGIGIALDRLDALNELLIHPPLPGFDLSRSLGLVVVARLCERIGVSVSLRSAPGVGTSAMVSVPIALVVAHDHDHGRDRSAVDDPRLEPLKARPGALPTPTAAAVAVEDLPTPVDAPMTIDLVAAECDAIPATVARVVANTDADAPPLPRRQPVPPDPVPVGEPLPPGPRTPAAVFELVARYEAGIRRADRAESADAPPS